MNDHWIMLLTIPGELGLVENHLNDVQLGPPPADSLDVLAGLSKADPVIGGNRARVVAKDFQPNLTESMTLERFGHHESCRLRAVSLAPTILLTDHDPE